MRDEHTEYEVKIDKQNKTNFNVSNLPSSPFSPLKKQKHEKPPCFVKWRNRKNKNSSQVNK